MNNIRVSSSSKFWNYPAIDFMNIDFIKDNLIAEEVKTVDQIQFHIKRYLKEGFVFKEIRFTDNNNNYFFTEKVRAISLKNFKSYFDKTGITLLDVFGDYQLNKFYNKTSERLILIFK